MTGLSSPYSVTSRQGRRLTPVNLWGWEGPQGDPCQVGNLTESVAILAQASRLKLAAKAVELGGSRRLLKEKKFSRGQCA